MKRCCECKKFVWPWQESSLAGDSIHATCHQKLMNEVARDIEIRQLMSREIADFESVTGIHSNVHITKL